jgi:hypothetical protein
VEHERRIWLERGLPTEFIDGRCMLMLNDVWRVAQERRKVAYWKYQIADAEDMLRIRSEWRDRGIGNEVLFQADVIKKEKKNIEFLNLYVRTSMEMQKMLKMEMTGLLRLFFTKAKCYDKLRNTSRPIRMSTRKRRQNVKYKY